MVNKVNVNYNYPVPWAKSNSPQLTGPGQLTLSRSWTMLMTVIEQSQVSRLVPTVIKYISLLYCWSHSIEVPVKEFYWD